MLSENGKNASEPRVTSWFCASHAFFASAVKTSGSAAGSGVSEVRDQSNFTSSVFLGLIAAKYKTTPASKTIKRKTTTKKDATKATTTQKAKKILDAQKSAWSDIWSKHVSESRHPKESAKTAGREYREKYGKTRKARWKNALKEAKKS